MFYLSAAYIVKTMISGGNLLKEYIEERAVAIANYIIDYNATVRQTARKFGISKSTVHKDVTDRLENINRLWRRRPEWFWISIRLSAISEAVWLPKKNISISFRHAAENNNGSIISGGSYPESGIRNQERLRSHRRTQPFPD